MAAEFELWSRFFTRAELYATNSTLGGFRYQPNQKTKKFDGYAKEAESVMSAARESADWRPSKTRRILRSQYLAKIPLLRRLILRKYGYLGHRIVRTDFDSSEGRWEIQKYPFL